MIVITIFAPIIVAVLFASLLWMRGKRLQKRISQTAPEPPTKFQRAKSQLELRVWAVAEVLSRDWVIPDEKMQAVFDYVTHTYVKHADMKPERVARNAAEYFKLNKKIEVLGNGTFAKLNCSVAINDKRTKTHDGH